MYCESAGVNCFWIRNDLIQRVLGVNITLMQKILNPKFLYRKAKFAYRNTNNKWHHVNC